MKKLNRNGFLTIELVITSVMCFVIAFFLIDLTMNLLSKTDDMYLNVELEIEKNLIIKNVRQNIKKSIIEHDGKINSVVCKKKKRCELTMADGEIFILAVQINGENKKIIYRDNNSILYSKVLNKNVNDLKLNVSNNVDNTYYILTISLENLFLKDKSDMNVLIYNGS